VSTYLRVLAVLLLIAGGGVSALATRAALGDETYFRAAQALERHSDHILFQAEYHAALARHVGYILAAVLSGVAGVVGSAMLLALAAILQRLDRVPGGR
jgi:hypothetical protein